MVNIQLKRLIINIFKSIRFYKTCRFSTSKLKLSIFFSFFYDTKNFFFAFQRNPAGNFNCRGKVSDFGEKLALPEKVFLAF